MSFLEPNRFARDNGLCINTTSRGLGSSAAIAVAFTRASYDFLGKPLSDAELIEEANWQIRLYFN
jgi:mevalonate kinase